MCYREISLSFQGCFSVADQRGGSASMHHHLCSLYCYGSLSRLIPLSILSFSFLLRKFAKSINFSLGHAITTFKCDIQKVLYLCDITSKLSEMRYINNCQPWNFTNRDKSDHFLKSGTFLKFLYITV